MRLGAVVVVVVALGLASASCTDRYGTYITIRADRDLAFDQLELYLGVEMGTQVPTTPNHTVVTGEPQLLVRRVEAPSDFQRFSERQIEFTYFIPPGGENDELGRYLLAIGYANGQRVAIGELFDFRITDEWKVLLYDLPLQAYEPTKIEEWGRPVLDCLRYDNVRDGAPSTVAIVRGDDADCDSFLDRSSDGATDCEPLFYCDGSGTGDCLGRTPCVHDPAGCSIGACINKDGASTTCTDEACVADILCEACDLTRSPAEILECALQNNATHPSPDLGITTQGSQVLCNDPQPTIVLLTLPFPCTNPVVAGVSYFNPSDPFSFSISNNGAMPNVCRLEIRSTVAGSEYVGAPHLLVLVEVNNRRVGFVLGMIASGGACPPPGESQQHTYAPIIGTCVP